MGKVESQLNQVEERVYKSVVTTDDLIELEKNVNRKLEDMNMLNFGVGSS